MYWYLVGKTDTRAQLATYLNQFGMKWAETLRGNKTLFEWEAQQGVTA